MQIAFKDTVGYLKFSRVQRCLREVMQYRKLMPLLIWKNYSLLFSDIFLWDNLDICACVLKMSAISFSLPLECSFAVLKVCVRILEEARSKLYSRQGLSFGVGLKESVMLIPLQPLNTNEKCRACAVLWLSGAHHAAVGQ